MTLPVRMIVVLVLAGAPGLFGRLPSAIQVEPGRSGKGAAPWSEEVLCKGRPEGSSCWMELANQPGCYVWNSYFEPDETVTWTAACAEGLAEGTGTLTEVWDGGRKTKEKTGSLVEGKAQGPWIYRDQDGTGAEGSYEDGDRHGHWVERLADGTVQEGPYEAGKRQGRWVLRFASGTVMEGPFVEGRQQGRWVLRLFDGTVMEGPFVAGRRHGRWVERGKDGYVAEGPYVDSLRHGWWIMRKKGLVVEETYFAMGQGGWGQR